MRRPLEIKGRHLGQSSDLTLLAPLRQGLVGSLESVTYKSRAKLLLETLHSMRSRSHEYAYVRMISDAVERVGAIQSVRVAVVEPQDLVLLSVTFDGNWESYLRALWQKVGGLLDLIFCNTEGYVDARLNRFEDWAAWVRRVQSETAFFYGAPAATARDVQFHRRQERRRLSGPADAARDVRECTDVLPTPEQSASLNVDSELSDPISPKIRYATQLQQGLRGAAALYRMADLYLPGSTDGARLHRATTELLSDFVTGYQAGAFDWALNLTAGKLRERFARELQWLFGSAPGPDLGDAGDSPWPADLSNIQGGILEGWRGITHGALVMMSFDSPNSVARFLDALRPQLATAATSHDVARGTTVSTVALTMDGLYALGADSALLNAMPEDFRQGMAARAGLLGDVRRNHPDRWSLPMRTLGAGRIALDAVHAVVLLRANTADDTLIPLLDTTDPRHPLRTAITALSNVAVGARVIAVESLRRLYKKPATREDVHEHFGYQDGLGQPQIAESVSQPDYDGNVLPVGELLRGYPHSADAQEEAREGDDDAEDSAKAWLHDSSFLVVRKYRQHVDRFERAIAGVKTAGGKPLDKEIVAAKLMGRDRAGKPVVDSSVTGNAFDFSDDLDGSLCPLPAHIRRGNPRDEARPGASRPARSRPARIMRRSMSFGPTVAEPATGERGLVFMAYNSSLSEQFEVVQRWMTGGNSTGTSSGASCPLLGVAESGRRRHFRFVHNGAMHHAELDGHGPLFDDPQPLVQLEWGTYLWVPSMTALRRLIALAAADGAEAEAAWDLARGRALLADLLERSAGPCPHSARLAWKAALEDMDAMSSFDSASLWAAIREDHGGVLRTPYGVLVGDHKVLHDTLADPTQVLSAAGYQHRLKGSLGEIYLGLDDDGPGCRYRVESSPVNAAIQALPAVQAFELARDAVLEKIDALVKQATALADFAGNPRFETTFAPRELFDEVLACLCEAWCGLTTAGGRFTRGPARWDWKPGEPPQYPGHFMAPSRYTFQPQPGADVEEFGIAHGKAVRSALRLLVDDWRMSGVTPTQPLANAILTHPLAAHDADFAARCLAGVVMGFVPTLDGALRSVANQWLSDGTFGSLRARYGGAPCTLSEAKDRLVAPLQRSLQLRPVPDLIWRTAAQAHQIDGTAVPAAEQVVFGLASAAQQMLAAGHRDDALSMFGGVRGTGSPTHACPGYEAAMAAMLGALAGLVATTHPLAAVHGTTALRVEGDSNVPPSKVQTAIDTSMKRLLRLGEGLKAVKDGPPSAAVHRATALRGGINVPRGKVTFKKHTLQLGESLKAAKPAVLVWGDSWVNDAYRSDGNLAHQLEVDGHNVPTTFVFGDGMYSWFPPLSWLKLKDLAEGATSPRFKAGVQKALRNALRDLGPGAVVLLSGGGNDATEQRTLRRLVTRSPGGLNATEVTKFVRGELFGYYKSVIELIQATPRSDGTIAPVVVHGYDHPLPEQGGGFLGQILCGSLDYSETEAAGIMKELINELNRMLATLPAAFPNATVTHADLTGLIAAAANTKGVDPKTFWEDELHPTPAGFKVLTAELVKKL